MKVGEIWRRKLTTEKSLGGISYTNQLIQIIDIKYDSFRFSTAEYNKKHVDEKILDEGKDYIVYFYWLEFKYDDLLSRRLFLEKFEFVRESL